ncbi:MAG: Tm-1-like ATP-binding domain-containing protein [Planctomycetia bacterium]|nr:Tm-1-like ATP-binding domain-containing protein [Planctomycetia bacterium]
MATIAVLGTLDTKGREHAFVAERVRARGHDVILIDVGTGGEPTVTPDIRRADVAAAAGLDLAAVIARGDRGECVTAMAKAAPRLLERLVAEGRIQGVIALGGGGGSAIASAAMRPLPIGFPKFLVSTLASGNTAPYVGTSDLAMMPAVVDVQGLNRISRTILARAAGAICGMVEADVTSGDDKPLIVASMFGNTTKCIEAAVPLLEQAGYEVLVFAATGTGGRAMESLIASGLVAGVLDITTTELADELVGGVLSAGPERLDAAAKHGVPAIVAPGCLDMVNFGERQSVPNTFAGRTFYIHNPQVTLMRTTPKECTTLGGLLAKKVNASRAAVSVLIPRRGISVISAAGGPFHDEHADAALFQAIESGLRADVPCTSLDCEINDPAFARACVEALLANISQTHTTTANKPGAEATESR